MKGERQVVAVGGDGTGHEVINGLFDALGASRLPEVTYALLASVSKMEEECL